MTARLSMAMLAMLWLPVCLGAAEDLPGPLRRVGLDQRLNEQLPLDLEFRDETGQVIHLSDYFGQRPVILVLAYYRCPMLCNQVLNGLVDGLRGIAMESGKQFEVVVVSFDPREQPPLAAAKKATAGPRLRAVGTFSPAGRTPSNGSPRPWGSTTFTIRRRSNMLMPAGSWW